ncbi:MAG: TetR/AcrR family transcriptional regulator [Paracoccus sp. (in: a-proteobacteria)]
MSKDRHHHGNLREALIEAGMAMLNDGVPLTLRGAAQRVGVSHAAPAHHFQGLNGLRTAIAAQAMKRLDGILDKTGRNPEHSPFQKLLEMGLAYCEFATEYLPVFHLMFVSGEVDRADPAMLETSLATYAHLTRACEPFVSKDRDLAVLEHSIWSMTHGNALLKMQDVTRNAMAPTEAPPLEAQYRMLLNLTD